MADRRFQPETLAIHAGQIPDAATGARALPIYQTTSFVFDSADHAASLFNLQTFGNVYSRLSNPTVAALEERVAALEGGRAALASASGMAAEAMALLTLLQAGRPRRRRRRALRRHASACSPSTSRRLGIETHLRRRATTRRLRRGDAAEHARRLRRDASATRSLNVLDIAAVADVAHAHGVPLVVDNTVPSPFLCKPIALRRRHRRPLGDQVPRRPRHDAGRRDGRERQFPWDNGKFPRHDRAVARLPRRQVLRDLRRLRLHDAGAHGDAARLRRRAGADERVADPAGHRDAAAAHGAALRQRARGRRVPARRTRGSAGSTTRACPTIPHHALVARQMRAVDGAPGASGLLAFGVEGGARRRACASSRRRSS